jgi:hypothetical protein
MAKRLNKSQQLANNKVSLAPNVLRSHHDIESVLTTAFFRFYRTAVPQKQPTVGYRLQQSVMATWTMQFVVCGQVSEGTVGTDLCLISTRSSVWRPLMPLTGVCPALANWRILVKIVACRMFWSVYLYRVRNEKLVLSGHLCMTHYFIFIR